MHQLMAATLDTVLEEIRAIQDEARTQRIHTTRPVWPMIVLRTPERLDRPEDSGWQAGRRHVALASGAGRRISHASRST